MILPYRLKVPLLKILSPMGQRWLARGVSADCSVIFKSLSSRLYARDTSCAQTHIYIAEFSLGSRANAAQHLCIYAH